MADSMDNVKTAWEELAQANTELARLRDQFARARTLLGEGDPAEVLEMIATRFQFAEDGRWPEAGQLRRVAYDIREALAQLGV